MHRKEVLHPRRNRRMFKVAGVKYYFMISPVAIGRSVDTISSAVFSFRIRGEKNSKYLRENAFWPVSSILITVKS